MTDEIQGMEVNEDEALLIITLVGFCLAQESFVYTPVGEGLREVKLLRRIAGYFPSLQSHVDFCLSEEGLAGLSPKEEVEGK